MEFLLVPLPPILEIRYEIFFIFFPHFLKTCFAFCNLLQPFWSHYLICYLHSYRVSKHDWAQQYPKIPCLRLGDSPPHPTTLLSFGIISPNLLGHLCTQWCCFFSNCNPISTFVVKVVVTFISECINSHSVRK